MFPIVLLLMSMNGCMPYSHPPTMVLDVSHIQSVSLGSLAATAAVRFLMGCFSCLAIIFHLSKEIMYGTYISRGISTHMWLRLQIFITTDQMVILSVRNRPLEVKVMVSAVLVVVLPFRSLYFVVKIHPEHGCGLMATTIKTNITHTFCWRVLLATLKKSLQAHIRQRRASSGNDYDDVIQCCGSMRNPNSHFIVEQWVEMNMYERRSFDFIFDIVSLPLSRFKLWLRQLVNLVIKYQSYVNTSNGVTLPSTQ